MTSTAAFFTVLYAIVDSASQRGASSLTASEQEAIVVAIGNADAPSDFLAGRGRLALRQAGIAANWLR